ncbi:PQQ-dependent sugar dehydrogenase [Nitrincola alkalisediminis]|uniref:PQQ-dependent sugar dehydrogenase n=1 Tax=Nitrincola alkalisediminis TaxID=1366656 RepID=UPI001874B6D9|nr:PQQ-dependent sugar dehydrogenase [Nitrincola alkalisediminis]
MKFKTCSLLVCLTLGGYSSLSWSNDRFSTDLYSLNVKTHVDGLVNPWSLAFLPEGGILVTERPGRLRLIEAGVLRERPIEGVPDVAASGQGGLLDIALHPDFEENRWLYLSFSDRTAEGLTTRVIRARYQDGRLTDHEDIFEALPRSSGGRHFGGRLLFDRAGYLYLSVGDRGEMDRAQDLADHAGSIIRLHDDGRIPDDNPFVDNPQAKPEIYSWGHRNPQGLVLHPETGDIWSHEHGPRGGDEINRIQASLNYGWPKATHGINYTGFSISPHQTLPGMESPLLYWTPSIAPSGMTFYTGDDFPEWQGQLLSGALSHRLVSRVSIDSAENPESVVEVEQMLKGLGRRIRDIRQDAEGRLWLLTDESPGRVMSIHLND